MRYYIHSAHIKNRVDGSIHWVVRRSDGSYYVTRSWLWKLKKGYFHDFVMNVR